MLGLGPFDYHPYDHLHHAASQPTLHRGGTPRDHRPAEPHVSTDKTADAYTITISAPDGYELDVPRASLTGTHELELHGVLQPPSSVCEYVTLGRTGVYAAPGRQLVGVAPARTLLRGEAPTRGWVALAGGDDADGWVDEDDVRMLSRPPSPQRFARAVELPSDALARRATSRVTGNGSLHITIPRLARDSARAAPLAKAPRAPQRPAPTKAPAKVAPAPAPAPTPAPAPAPRPRHSSAKREHAALLPSAEGPVLVETTEMRAENVQRPAESMQEWYASLSGGFEQR